uniref:Uncharacterized protein n=1 Tax=Lygus hesperus TaxID=30085 RepID=A0A146LQX8_LYGHE
MEPSRNQNVVSSDDSTVAIVSEASTVPPPGHVLPSAPPMECTQVSTMEAVPGPSSAPDVPLRTNTSQPLSSIGQQRLPPKRKLTYEELDEEEATILEGALCSSSCSQQHAHLPLSSKSLTSLTSAPRKPSFDVSMCIFHN